MGSLGSMIGGGLYWGKKPSEQSWGPHCRSWSWLTVHWLHLKSENEIPDVWAHYCARSPPLSLPLSWAISSPSSPSFVLHPFPSVFSTQHPGFPIFSSYSYRVSLSVSYFTVKFLPWKYEFCPTFSGWDVFKTGGLVSEIDYTIGGGWCVNPDKARLCVVRIPGNVILSSPFWIDGWDAT